MSTAKTMGGIGIGSAISGDRPITSRIDRDLAQVLNHLLHLGYDLAGAYKTARARLKNPALLERLRAIDESHLGYMRDLSECVVNLGHTPTTSGDLHGLLERGRVILGDLRGELGILKAMAANEKDMCTAYKRALAHPGMPSEISVVISKALAHETRHRVLYDHILGRYVG